MHLQRPLMPEGRMSWTMYDHERVFAEVREFIVHLEAMRPGACLQPRK